MENKTPSIRDIISRADEYLAIADSPDFIEFREKVILPRLEAYILSALSESLADDESKNRALSCLARYQELAYVSRDVFAAWEQAAKTSRENLKEGSQP